MKNTSGPGAHTVTILFEYNRRLAIGGCPFITLLHRKYPDIVKRTEQRISPLFDNYLKYSRKIMLCFSSDHRAIDTIKGTSMLKDHGQCGKQSQCIYACSRSFAVGSTESIWGSFAMSRFILTSRTIIITCSFLNTSKRPSWSRTRRTWCRRPTPSACSIRAASAHARDRWKARSGLPVERLAAPGHLRVQSIAP